MALLLDLVFSRIQESRVDAGDPWIDATFRLLESKIRDADPAGRAGILTQVARESGLPLRLLDPSEAGVPASDHPIAVVNEQEQRLYLKWIPALNATVQVGPLDEAPDARPSHLLPMLFYLSILVVVGLWLRPLLRDMNLLTAASRDFAADYREPLNTAGRVTHLDDLAHNLDEMSAKLSQLLQGNKELAAALSHEMRTPLARIRFALAVLDNESSESVKTQLRDINGDVSQLEKIITRLLEHVRLDHPDLRMDWQEVDLSGWLRHVLAASTLPGKKVELDIAETLEVATIDPRLMELAVSNLVANACRHARERVVVRAALQGNSHVISVEDDGDGIPVESRSEVFRAFHTLESHRRGSAGGVGLGLAIVARVATLHGGRARAEASPGLSGAMLTVEWPRRSGRRPSL